MSNTISNIVADKSSIKQQLGDFPDTLKVPFRFFSILEPKHQFTKVERNSFNGDDCFIIGHMPLYNWVKGDGDSDNYSGKPASMADQGTVTYSFHSSAHAFTQFLKLWDGASAFGSVTIGHPDWLDTLSEVTISAYIYLQDMLTYETICDNENYGAGGTFQGWTFRVKSDYSISFNIGDKVSGVGSSTEISTAAGVVSLNTLHHVAATWDGVTMKIYLDGLEVASGASNGATIGAHDKNCTWGGIRNADGNWRGLMGDCRIYTQAATAEQVTSLASNPTSNNIGFAVLGRSKLGSASKKTETVYAIPPGDIFEDHYVDEEFIETEIGTLQNWWQLDGDLTDSQGSNNLTITGTETYGTGNAFTNAIDLSGSSNYLTMDSAITLNKERAALSFWTKQDVSDTSYLIFANTASTSSFDEHILFDYNNNDIFLETNTNLDGYQKNVGGNSSGVWHHTLIIFDHQNGVVWRDGVKYDMNVYGSVDRNHLTLRYIAGLATNYGTPFAGLIGDIRVYTVPPNDAQAQYLYNDGNGRTVNTCSTGSIDTALIDGAGVYKFTTSGQVLLSKEIFAKGIGIRNVTVQGWDDAGDPIQDAANPPNLYLSDDDGQTWVSASWDTLKIFGGSGTTLRYKLGSTGACNIDRIKVFINKG